MSRVTNHGIVPTCIRCRRRFSLRQIFGLLIAKVVACSNCGARHQVGSCKVAMDASRLRPMIYVAVGLLFGFLFDEVVAFTILVLGLLAFLVNVIRGRIDRIELEDTQRAR